jgi:hypothetical protein
MADISFNVELGSSGLRQIITSGDKEDSYIMFIFSRGNEKSPYAHELIRFDNIISREDGVKQSPDFDKKALFESPRIVESPKNIRIPPHRLLYRIKHNVSIEATLKTIAAKLENDGLINEGEKERIIMGAEAANITSDGFVLARNPKYPPSPRRR